MLEQLKELKEMQRLLDESILKENGLVYDESIAEQNRIALFVELGEMMNEFPTKFKHWKKTARDNRDRGLEEYVDALHFTLSLMNYYKVEINEKYHDYNANINKTLANGDTNLLHCVKISLEDCDNIFGLINLFKIGNYLGFTWDEIYQAYLQKNATNYNRLRMGY